MKVHCQYNTCRASMICSCRIHRRVVRFLNDVMSANSLQVIQTHKRNKTEKHEKSKESKEHLLWEQQSTTSTTTIVTFEIEIPVVVVIIQFRQTGAHDLKLSYPLLQK